MTHRSAEAVESSLCGEVPGQAAVGLVRRRQEGRVEERFGPMLAAKHWGSEDRLKVDAETLRRWMLFNSLRNAGRTCSKRDSMTCCTAWQARTSKAEVRRFRKPIPAAVEMGDSTAGRW